MSIPGPGLGVSTESVRGTVREGRPSSARREPGLLSSGRCLNAVGRRTNREEKPDLQLLTESV